MAKVNDSQFRTSVIRLIRSVMVLLAKYLSHFLHQLLFMTS